MALAVLIFSEGLGCNMIINGKEDECIWIYVRHLFFNTGLIYILEMY